MKKKWQKSSWRDLSISQQPIYSDKDLLKLVEGKIEKLPPLVFAGEVRSLKEKLKKVKDLLVKKLEVKTLKDVLVN